MRLSVVTPNYNYGRFLKKALESVLSQVSDGETAADLSIEHIVIDGGSTDDSVEILKDWSAKAAALPSAIADRYSFSYVSEPDKGQTDAINKGLRRATGDWVCWLNADEWYLPGSLIILVKATVLFPKADLIYGESRFVYEDGRPAKTMYGHGFHHWILLWYGCHIPSCATFWKRSWIERGILLDDTYKVTMDFEYWAHLAAEGARFAFVPKTLAAFLWHDSNVSEVFVARRREERLRVQRKYGCGSTSTPETRQIQIKIREFAAHQAHRVLKLARMMGDSTK